MTAVNKQLTIKKTKIMASSPITSWQIDGETMETVTDFIFLGSKITADGDCSHEIKRRLLFGRKAMTRLDSILKSQRCHLAKKGLHSRSYGFSSSHVWLWKLGYKESWAPKNWFFWTVVLEKTPFFFFMSTNNTFYLFTFLWRLKITKLVLLYTRGKS